MKKFVSSIIYSLFMTLLSVAVIFLLQAPLMSFIYYGFLSSTNNITFNTNIINKVNNTDSITIIVLIIQTILTIGFISVMYFFIKKVINVFLKNEKLIKPYYLVFFFMTSIVPVIIILLAIFLKVRLTIFAIIIEGIFTILNIVIIIFSRKILPDTTDYENRKYLFSEVSNDDE